ncbi:uncharacterized protein LOC129592269 [Paramacrobiotus metropolitanus]|uniref:uncharacterized protein LOC129592269 n=1 Tax=Paramacrobiotus metropolitanus TaxID=2943436 RepID=UPI00244593FF|nr:uncharacterized protein LOC129592269 [Paramacrobiotus metropolitanus]
MDLKEVVPTSGSRCLLAGELLMSCDPMVWILERSAYKTHCAYCWQESMDLRTCSGCQVADWKGEHKLECALLKENDSVDLDHLLDELKAEPAGSRPSDTDLESRRGRIPVLSLVLGLTTKLTNKIKKNTMIDIPGMGSKSVKDLVLMMSENPLQPNMDRLMRKNLSTGAVDIGTMGYMNYCGLITYNGVAIYDYDALTLRPCARIGLALYPQAPLGRMTPVCWDINVVLNRRGRQLLIHAVEDIPHFTGLRDLRYNHLEESFRMTRAERQAKLEKLRRHRCSCSKCTEAYDADINPLKCVTVGCINGIPSDSRALEACSECGAVNGERLAQFRRYMDQYDTISSRCPEEYHLAMIMHLYKEMDAAGILQPNAHFRYVCGWEVAQGFYDNNRFEDGWKMMQGFAACARKVCPKYADFRAALLISVSQFTAEALEKHVLNGSCKVSGPLKPVLETLAAEVYTQILDYTCEAKNVFAMLFDKQSKEFQMSDSALKQVASSVCRIEQAFRDRK